LHYLTSIFLTLLFFFTGGNFAVAKNKVSSASLGDLCNLAVNQEFLTTDCTEYTDKSDLDRQGTTNAKVFNTSLESLFRDSIGVHSFLISASLGELCALAVNLSSSRLTTDTYDANGNTLVSKEGGTGVSPVSSSSVTDVYSFDNRLIRRTTPDGKTIDLTYTPDGHRLTKFITQNGLTQRLVHYLTDANNPTGYAQVIEEKQPLDTASPLKKVNLYGHDLISSEERGTGVSPVSSIFYTYDGLGSVRSITDTTGDIKESYDYDAYGTLIGLAKRNTTTGLLESSNLSSTIPDLQSDYLYTGEQFDSDLGMYFLRARYLNTNTGRFHSQDTYEGDKGGPLSLHKYLYANGNPAMMVDPSGRFSLSEVTTAISIALSFSNIAVVSAVSLFNGFPDSFSFGVFGSVEIGKGFAVLGGAEIEFSPRERKMGVYTFGGPEVAASVTVGAGPHVKGELGTFEAWTWEAPGAKSNSIGGFLLGAVAAGNIFGGYETTETGAKIYVVGASWSFPSNAATTLGGFVLGGPTYKLYEREMTEGQMIAAVAAAELANTAAIQTQSGIGFNGASGAALAVNPFAAAAWVHMVYGRK
jgi:RHS repeat-associated protein